ncbi:transglycosylase SLT domain-containing protein [Salinisphaera aquimarina]|uniref:Transglycosylase SLT domain-containing protein n=1 Tax=Salinisphaera aquimarina TaxID=2094031 RepID=A0ABV7EL49_9GAMM
MRLFLIAGLCLLTATAQAATPAQRSLFRDALAAAQQGTLGNEQAALRQLQTYPLYNYISAADLRRQLDRGANSALDDEIEGFIRAHPDLPPAESLRRNWLPSLARRGRWQTLLDNTDDDDSTTNSCRAVNARIKLGMNPRQAALDLWRVGRSQPDACDPVFAWLDQQGLMGPDEILRRARLAVVNGQYGLTRYLGRQLPDNLKALTEQWLAVSETPTNLSYSRNLDGDVAVHAFKRLALRDLDAAADLLPVLAQRLNLDATQQFEMKRYVALLYAQNHESQALAWFARIDPARMADDEHALGWEIRAAIYQQRWPLVIEAIRKLPPSLANDEEWRYWHARALAETGNDSQANAIFEPLSRERSYHGYLAADALGRDYSLNERPLPRDAAAAARVQANPALARADELRALGMDHAAGLEWNALTRDMDKPALAEAARIAYQWQWYSRAIITLAKADYWDDLDIRYPTPYSDAVRRFGDDNGLDPAYVLAIIRTESLFQPQVRSSAGAVGLMQLMPGTARLVARQMGTATPPSSALGVPEINIQLGTRYLADMLARWNDNIALATASYNAGPNRIARWLPAKPMDPTIWIANIPYTETRGYVQRAMSHMTVFQQRLDEDIVPLDTRIDTIQSGYADPGSLN